MAVTDPISDGFTVADLDAMPDDGRRYELIGGSIIVNPPPAVEHQRASARLQQRLVAALDDEFEVFDAPIGLALPTGDAVEPDVVVVEAGRSGRRLELPVLLVVELVSPGSARHDTVTKSDAYARAGIEHYWLVDTRAGQRSFRAMRLRGDTYTVTVRSAERIDTTEPVELHLPLDDLFTARPPR